MKYLLGALIGLEIVDGLMSHFLIRGGLVREANPFLQPLVGEHGFLLLKVFGVLLCAVILWDIYKQFPKLALVSTSCFVMLYGAIVAWSLYVFSITRV